MLMKIIENVFSCRTVQDGAWLDRNMVAAPVNFFIPSSEDSSSYKNPLSTYKRNRKMVNINEWS